MKATTRLSTKGQVVLPLEIRTARSWGSGTEFAVEETLDGVLLRPIRPGPSATLDMVVGALHRKGRAKTLAQMDAGVQREVRRRHKLGRS
jgi:AbrB family looped-hinge helix DNA binding protein